MKRSELKADLENTRAWQQRSRTNSKPKRRPISECTPEQREAVFNAECVVCLSQPCDPAHLLPRSICPEGADDVRAVVPMCRPHHRAYDQQRTLSILEHLEPAYRVELGFAVERFGLISTLERVTNCRWRETEL